MHAAALKRARAPANADSSPPVATLDKHAMSTKDFASTRAQLETVIALARILERVEQGRASVSADEYQLIVQRLQAALSQELPAEALQSILAAHPSAAEVYENMQYEHAGLSRSSLERSVVTEMLTAQTLARIARAAKAPR